MLLKPKMFAVIEREIKEAGHWDQFESMQGPIRGRMMITEGRLPENGSVKEPKGDYIVFEASFDFYDVTMNIAFDPQTLEPLTGLWLNYQSDTDETPTQDWVEFFVTTILKHVTPGDIWLPIYSFVADVGDLTIVPTREDE